MRTAIICLGILVAALLVGMHQRQQITALEQRTAPNTAGSELRNPDQQHDTSSNVRPGKSHERPVAPSATQVFKTVLELLDTRRGSVSGGSNSAIDHPEIFAAIMKLDLVGQKELINLIEKSDDPKFSDNLYKCMLINLSLCAMADRHPEVALEILNHADERIGRFFNKRMRPQGMIHYVMSRLCDLDPAAGMEALVAAASGSVDSSWAFSPAQMIELVMERDPDLALQTIGKLPETQQVESWRVAVRQAVTREDSERVFRYLIEKPLSDRGKMTGTLGSLFGNVRKHAKSWEEFATWLGGMNLSEEQRRYVAPALASGGALGEEEHIAKWLLASLPPSKERNYLVWRTTIGFWQASAPDKAAALLKEQDINPEEMMELDKQGYLLGAF